MVIVAQKVEALHAKSDGYLFKTIWVLDRTHKRNLITKVGLWAATTAEKSDNGLKRGWDQII